MQDPADSESLLASDEPPAVDWRAGSIDPFFFVCEHASNRVPRALGDLGLPSEAFERHIAWDPGAAQLTLGLAERFGGAAVLQRYSRLVIDCNREPELPDAITPLSEDTPIPGNQGLGEDERRGRIAAIWAPFHAAVDRLLNARVAARKPTALVTIHSFTPVYRGVSRPWHVGIISTGDRRFAEPMLAALSREAGLVVGDDQPYSARDNVDYTIRRHGRERGLPHVMIEVRNDLLRTARDVSQWVERLGDALTESAGAVGLPGPIRV
ncbi:N-formylglutamate amidohydrolase [Kaistia dalseonensis]|uniref:N-formylglutamate amidohydrolase n=1 Tax=Kaistia dalseonensis TaxID=410840 RepID=A0ABU0H694_9HYPH|nr:N-formylglutamate amidohydrolase [Kaistia dalseonensis]MCX5495236.1 N-formylglutamate amidohydrolase [Kaistia dalseonensis]MDQ0437822.1 putative N-formylglutamate amidohydrolase [Kaistia dalseonensis]